MNRLSVSLLAVVCLFTGCKTSWVNWTKYGGEGGKKYSSLSQINKSNVKSLRLAWESTTGETRKAFQATPIVVDGRMYFCSTLNKVIAINAKDGSPLWTYEPKHDHKPFFNVCRGVSYWKGNKKNQKCNERIITNTITGKLIALDANNGELCDGFGNKGIVNLYEGMGTNLLPGKAEYFWTSAPLIHKNQIVIGGAVGDNIRVNAPSGAVRSFDVKTGKLNWGWNPAPQKLIDEASDKIGSPEYGDYLRGTPNAWARMTSDTDNDLIFIPMGNATPDYFGGERHETGISKYSSAIVALNSSGKEVWHYRTVYRDVWDYDIGAQPVLAKITVKNKKTDVVIVGTKMSHIFVLDRKTGKEVFATKKINVPQNGVPEERLSPTQKIPTFPMPLYDLSEQSEIPGWWLEHLKSIKPEYAKYCKNLYASYPDKGLFAPVTEEGTLQIPGPLGGINWSGMSFNPENEVLTVNINKKPYGLRLTKRADCGKIKNPKPMLGTPYCIKGNTLEVVDSVEGMKDLYCYPPPYGEVIAIDFKAKKTLWKKPLGEYKGFKGTLNLGGFLSTAGGLSFIGAAKDRMFRAFDTKTGEVLWQYELPEMAAAAPMTYSIDGKQYVAIAVGGHFFVNPLWPAIDNKIMVFSLK